MKASEILREYIDVPKTVINMGDVLSARLQEDRTAKQKYPKEFIEWLIQINPLLMNKYGLWVLRLYIKKGLEKVEDLGRLIQALEILNRHKDKLPPEQRDIGRIKSLQELEDLVEPLVDIASRKEKRQEEKEEISKEIKVVYDGEDGKILIPLTEKAACYLKEYRLFGWCIKIYIKKKNDGNEKQYS